MVTLRFGFRMTTVRYSRSSMNTRPVNRSSLVSQLMSFVTIFDNSYLLLRKPVKFINEAVYFVVGYFYLPFNEFFFVRIFCVREFLVEFKHIVNERDCFVVEGFFTLFI